MANKKDIIKKHKGFLVILFIFLIWIISLFFISPQEIVSIVGVETGYLSIFLTSLIGVSGFASAPFYITFFTLVSTGEFNIFLLMLIIAPARTFGDFIVFVLGYKGSLAVKDLIGYRLQLISYWLSNKPYWLIPLIAYLYTSFTFLPQDILMIILGLERVRFRGVFVAVFLGNATFVIVVHLIALGLFSNLPIFS